MKNVAWNKVKVGSLCTRVTSGGTPKSTNAEYYDNGKIPWLNSKEVNFSHIYSTEKFITEKGLAESSAKWIEKNSVIVAMYGATAGQVAIAKIPLTTNQACCNLTIDDKLADYRYVYYYLWNQYQVLSGLANGGAQQNLNAQIIKEFEIQLPELSVQKSISEILFSLDEQIRINNTINHNLEEQAKAIFKSWFVDFEPFQNGKFVDSELGKIPEGWRVGTLNEIADITMGQSPQGASYNENAVGTVFYQGRAEFTDRFPSRRLFTTEPKRMANAGDVLLSVRAPVGDLNIANEPCCIGRGLAAIHAKNGFASFIFYTMQALKTELEKYNGEGTVFGCINKDSLSSQKVIIPPRNIIADFESIASSLDCQYFVDFNENIHLAQLRDTLLPKLMSGEIDVSEVEI